MITEEMIKEIIKELKRDADAKKERYKLYHNEYDIGTVNGLMRAVTIIRRHQLQNQK